MKSKDLTVKSMLEMTEYRAKGRQISGYSGSSNAGIETRDRNAHWRRLVALGLWLAFVFFVSIPAALCAQKQQGSWSDLNGLKVGQGVVVIESNMKRHGGEFVTVTDEAITLREKASDVSVKRENVARVSIGSGTKRGEHALIGLVVGAAIGTGVGAASGSKSGFLGDTLGIGALVGIVIGGIPGAAVGAVIPAHTTIYRAAPVTASH